LEDGEIKCSFSGKYISILSKKNGYFEILKINNSNHVDHNNALVMLDEFNRSETLHFLSQYEKLDSGCAS
jgi:hypothetical protein